MTRSELRLALEGFAERSQREHDRDVAASWHVASLSRSKHLPALKRLLSRRPLVPIDVDAAREAHGDIEDELTGGR